MDDSEMPLSELTFQSMIESIPNAIVLVNKEGKISYVNHQTEKLFQYPRTELIGQSIEQLIPDRFRKNHPAYRQAFFDSPSVRAMGAGVELFAVKKDGSEFPVEIGLNPLITVSGTLVLASVIDITERKKAHDRFRLIVESAPNAMVLVNSEGIITLTNTQAEKLFGYTKKELTGSRLEMLIPERFRGHHPEYRKGFFGAPSTRAMGEGRDLFALKKDNSEVQVEIGLNPIETDEGLAVLASIIDITKRKEQEAIKNHMHELEIKNRELEQFAYIASHDLQEPLRTISNYIQVIEEDHKEGLEEEARTYLETINRSTKRMSTLVKALLGYSRLGREKKLSWLDCNALVSEVIADLDNQIKTKYAQIQVNELPELYGYEAELRQLFQNLISNAIKFTHQEPQIHIGCEEQQDAFLFFVSDNGIGIDPKDFERIFQVFQHLHLNTEYEGYGIGLPNCKKIVEIHHGKIWVESEPGRGSTFYFTLSKKLIHE